MSDLATAEGILFRACAITGLYPDVLRAKSRIPLVAQTRQAVMYAMRLRTGFSFPQITKFMGLTDHTTGVHAAKVVPDRMTENAEFREFVESLLCADPVKPFSVDELLAEHRIVEAIPQPESGRTWSVKRDRPSIYVAGKHRPAVVRRPPPKPRPHAVQKSRREIIEEARENYESAMLIAGSRGLALSILTARARA